MTLRHLLIFALLLPAACHDETTRPVEFRVMSHTFFASTTSLNAASPSDSVACDIYAHVPMRDSITTPWSGQVDIYAWRGRPGTQYPSTNAVTGKAQLTVTRGPGDSLYVALEGVVVAGFGGRISSYQYGGATGAWTCDARLSLPSPQAGEARGVWYLSPDVPID